MGAPVWGGIRRGWTLREASCNQPLINDSQIYVYMIESLGHGRREMLDIGTKVPAKKVGRWFVNHADRASGEAITPLKLQKLVYYADAWFLANFDRSLIPEDFQAWAHGPAIPELYAKYRHLGWDAIPAEAGSMPPEEVIPFIERVFEEYSQYSAKKLEKMTHEELPWLEARTGIAPEAASTKNISKLSMRNFYAGRIGKSPIETLSGGCEAGPT